MVQGSCRIPASTTVSLTPAPFNSIVQTVFPGTVSGPAPSASPTSTIGPIPVTGSVTATVQTATATITPPNSPPTSTITALIPNIGAQIYVVQPGDRLVRIAAKFGLSLAGLEAANPQIRNPDLIYAGQSIFIPAIRITPTATPQP